MPDNALHACLCVFWETTWAVAESDLANELSWPMFESVTFIWRAFIYLALICA